MATLKEMPTWTEGIYQLEESDPVQGGENGIDNLQAKQLANRTLYLQQSVTALTASTVDGLGRNLLTVLGVDTIPAAMAALRRRCNNNGEIDDTKIPHFDGIMIGDYIDGLSLDGITAAPLGTAPQVWDDTYKNNRIIVSGLNTYKGSGDPENTKNHIVFSFRNSICKGAMNGIYITNGGYPGSELRRWLEGEDGDASGIFAKRLKAALGGDYILPISKYQRVVKNGQFEETVISFRNSFYSVWLPTDIEVCGISKITKPLFSGAEIQLPIYRFSHEYRTKKLNGARETWWLHDFAIEDDPDISDSCFYAITHDGHIMPLAADTPCGVSPVFCMA